MDINFKQRVLCAACAIALISVPFSKAQQSKQSAGPAPVPSQILTAKRVFIANAPGDNPPSSLGAPDSAYNQFYAAMRGWGRYELVPAPADADLVFEVSFGSPLAGVFGTSTTGCSSSRSSVLRVVVLDPKTQVPLWWFAEQIAKHGFREKAADAFDDTIGKLVDDVKKLVAQPATEISGAK